MTRELPALRSGATLSPIVPQSFDEAYRMAEAVVAAGMAPRSLNTTAKAMVAIMHGMEVGLTPLAALQSIAVVNGFPTIWGDGALGLVRASGLCEWIKEWHEQDGERVTAWCEVMRIGEPEPIRRCFSTDEAKRAGLLTKEGPWRTYPQRMLQMRARAYALRDGFADVLRGLRIREEVEDYQPIRDDPSPVGLRDRLVGESTIIGEGFVAAHFPFQNPTAAEGGKEAVQTDPPGTDASTGEATESPPDAAGPSETDKLAGIVDPSIATLADLEDQLRDCASPAAIESVKADLKDRLNALHGEDRMKAHDLIKKAYARI